jgi:hypothetical protein
MLGDKEYCNERDKYESQIYSLLREAGHGLTVGALIELLLRGGAAVELRLSTASRR